MKGSFLGSSMGLPNVIIYRIFTCTSPQFDSNRSSANMLLVRAKI